MIRARFESNFAEIDTGFGELVKDFPKIALETGREAFAVQREPLLDTLKFYPPELPNQKYIRTYRLRRGWKAYIEKINGNKFAFVVSNNTEYASMVVGSLAQAVSIAASFQADIHRGRWKLATTTVGLAFDDFLKEYDKQLSVKLSKYGKVSRRSL